jgi:DNA invertase Pin-like site-specific DNA recombinase
VRIVTLAEGDITHLHIGFKGTMNAIFLQDLADKTRRGLRGRVELGKAGGGLCFGYRVVRTMVGAEVTTGDRQIETAEADTVRRIFQDFSSGRSPKHIAKALNREGVQGPCGGRWSPSTIYGNAKRGTGILNNELYVGRLVWNRLRYVKNPDTGKRVSRLNEASQWITTEVPHLRIISDEVWSAAKDRQVATRHAIAKTGQLGAANRPRYLFSGLTKCGVCGAGFILGSAHRLTCFGAREQGVCSNRLTIRREEVEQRVLTALQDKLMRPDLFEDFCDEFTREMNRLRMAQRAGLAAAERELEQVRAGIRDVIEAVKAGLMGPELKLEMDRLQARKEALLAQLAAADALPPLLHPTMAAIYHEKIASLAAGLEHPERRPEAILALRGLVDAIVLVPEGGELRIEVKGDLAAMLAAAQSAKRSPETGDLSLQVAVVAGACNQRYLQLWSAAA